MSVPAHQDEAQIDSPDRLESDVVNSSRVFVWLVALLCIGVDACTDKAADHYAAGVAKAKKGDYDGSLAEFDRFIKLDPAVQTLTSRAA